MRTVGGGEGGPQSEWCLAWATSMKLLSAGGLSRLLCSPKGCEVRGTPPLWPSPLTLSLFLYPPDCGFSKGRAMGHAAVSLALNMAFGTVSMQ